MSGLPYQHKDWLFGSTRRNHLKNTHTRKGRNTGLQQPSHRPRTVDTTTLVRRVNEAYEAASRRRFSASPRAPSISIPCPYNRPAEEMPTVTAFNPRNHQGSPASPAQRPIHAQVAQSSPWKTGVHYTEWIRRLPPHPFSFAVVLNLLWGQFNPQRQWENKTVSCGWYHRWYPT